MCKIEALKTAIQVPPPGIDFTLPSPPIGQSAPLCPDPPWMPHVKTRIQELTISEEDTTVCIWVRSVFVDSTQRWGKHIISSTDKLSIKQLSTYYGTSAGLAFGIKMRFFTRITLGLMLGHILESKPNF